MQHIPVVVLDDFFDTPTEVRSFALKQTYKAHPTGKWPGSRSQDLRDLHPELWELTCKKFLSLFADLRTDKATFELTMWFQKVNKRFDSGWVHNDEESVTGIIYLSEDAPLQSGTSIYRLKPNLLAPNKQANSGIKHKAFLGGVDPHIASAAREAHNSQYEETIKISNVFNRLVAFDSHLHHAAQDFFGDKHNERLTLIFFIKNFSMTNQTPVTRFRQVEGAI